MLEKKNCQLFSFLITHQSQQFFFKILYREHSELPIKKEIIKNPVSLCDEKY